MIIVCPRCQTKLRIPDEKLKPEGSKFKCPKCPAILNVRRPAAHQPAPPVEPVVPVAPPEPVAAPPEPTPPARMPFMALVAHENRQISAEAEAALKALGFSVLIAGDGVQAMIGALKVRPSVVLADPALPKINGFDLAKTMKDRPELTGIKAAIISSSTDYRRVRRNPAASADIDAYIDEAELSTGMNPLLRIALSVVMPEGAPALQTQPAAPPPPPSEPEEDDAVKRAKRLVRTIFSDIALYNPEKLVDALRTNTFEHLFEEDIREGFKHYQSRVPDDVRKQRDFFKETMDDFIATKKRALGID